MRTIVAPAERPNATTAASPPGWSSGSRKNWGSDTCHQLKSHAPSGKRAARIVYRMRDRGREPDGEKEPGRTTDLLDQVQTVSRKRAENAHVRFVREESDPLPLVPMVADRVQQVFVNLVLNAIDAMPEGGDLRIRTRVTATPPGVEVAFKDTGVGIPPEDLENLFEAFHSDREHGLGLGLHVSRNVVRDHGVVSA